MPQSNERPKEHPTETPMWQSSQDPVSTVENKRSYKMRRQYSHGSGTKRWQ